MTAIPIDVPATADSFSEAGYLAANPDVASALRAGLVRSARQHFEAHGRREGRRQRVPYAIEAARAEKARRIETILRADMPYQRRGSKFDFLTEELRQLANLADTENVSSFDYDGQTLELVKELPDGLILDCGAGQKPTYYSNVVNLEIVDYPSTDVLGIGERLPFKDGSFDGVISIAVLEHVRDPFACAGEIVRVLKPGGRLICCVPFLQPLHGYPHHYYNMTGQGLRALFDGKLSIDEHSVPNSLVPIHALTWIIQSWARGLEGRARRKFLGTRLSDLLDSPFAYLDREWVNELTAEKNFELAAGTLLIAHKPPAE